MSLKQLIKLKNSHKPHHGFRTTIRNDHDHFPYMRFFKGKAQNDEPIVDDRMAGWNTRQGKCYQKTTDIVPSTSKQKYPNHLFQTSISTVYPQFSNQENPTFEEEQQASVQKSCVGQYR